SVLASGSSAATARLFESGAHSKAFTPVSNTAACCASPPSAGMTQSCFLPTGVLGSAPERSDRKAIQRPSGDHAASLEEPAARLRRRAPAADASASQSEVSKALVSQLASVRS